MSIDLLGDYKATQASIKEIYSDENLGMASSKEFWMRLFEKDKTF